MLSDGRCATQIRRLTAADMKKVLALVSQIAPAADLVQSARTQFEFELDQPHLAAIRLVAVVDNSVVGTLGCGAGPFPSRQALWSCGAGTACCCIPCRTCTSDQACSLSPVFGLVGDV